MLLGSGASGDVFRAKFDGKTVAVKLLRPQQGQHAGEGPDVGSLDQLLYSNVKAAAALRRELSIVATAPEAFEHICR